MPKKHSDEPPRTKLVESSITRLARDVHLRLEREYGRPVEFVIAAVDPHRPYWVDIATNSQDGPLFRTLMAAIKESAELDSKTFVVPEGGRA